jgi:hypothetical protein
MLTQNTLFDSPPTRIEDPAFLCMEYENIARHLLTNAPSIVKHHFVAKGVQFPRVYNETPGMPNGVQYRLESTVDLTLLAVAMYCVATTGVDCEKGEDTMRAQKIVFQWLKDELKALMTKDAYVLLKAFLQTATGRTFSSVFADACALCD